MKKIVRQVGYLQRLYWDARSTEHKINYSVLDMFQTSKCSSSERLVHAVLWYFFHAEIIIKGYWIP